VRAVVCDRYGSPDVLHVADVDDPVPADDEVLVRVRATTVNRTDCAIRSGRPFVARPANGYFNAGSLTAGLRRPPVRILGTELAGEIESVGAHVTEFAPGDRVFGVNVGRYGAHAELCCVRERAPLAHLPAGIGFAEAAGVCDGGILALNAMRPAELGPGRRLLVYGASGSIGTAAVQLAKHQGTHVTAVCNTTNVELVRSLGADAVVDYLTDDFTRNGETYDVILDAVGKHSFGRCRDSLVPGGVYLPTDGIWNIVLSLAARRSTRRRVVFAIPPRYRKEDVVFLRGLVEAGEYRAVVDRTVGLDEVADATRYVETGQKTGNVVVLV
jgi:NADPH:quinone reductase-like Zn-dependent oxidoreductase